MLFGKSPNTLTKTIVIPKGSVQPNETVIIEIPEQLVNTKTIIARRQLPQVNNVNNNVEIPQQISSDSKERNFRTEYTLDSLPGDIYGVQAPNFQELYTPKTETPYNDSFRIPLARSYQNSSTNPLTNNMDNLETRRTCNKSISDYLISIQSGTNSGSSIDTYTEEITEEFESDGNIHDGLLGKIIRGKIGRNVDWSTLQPTIKTMAGTNIPILNPTYPQGKLLAINKDEMYTAHSKSCDKASSACNLVAVTGGDAKEASPGILGPPRPASCNRTASYFQPFPPEHKRKENCPFTGNPAYKTPPYLKPVPGNTNRNPLYNQKSNTGGFRYGAGNNRTASQNNPGVRNTNYNNVGRISCNKASARENNQNLPYTKTNPVTGTIYNSNNTLRRANVSNCPSFVPKRSSTYSAGCNPCIIPNRSYDTGGRTNQSYATNATFSSTTQPVPEIFQNSELYESHSTDSELSYTEEITEETFETSDEDDSIFGRILRNSVGRSAVRSTPINCNTANVMYVLPNNNNNLPPQNGVSFNRPPQFRNNYCMSPCSNKNKLNDHDNVVVKSEKDNGPKIFGMPPLADGSIEKVTSDKSNPSANASAFNQSEITSPEKTSNYLSVMSTTDNDPSSLTADVSKNDNLEFKNFVPIANSSPTKQNIIDPNQNPTELNKNEESPSPKRNPSKLSLNIQDPQPLPPPPPQNGATNSEIPIPYNTLNVAAIGKSNCSKGSQTWSHDKYMNNDGSNSKSTQISLLSKFYPDTSKSMQVNDMHNFYDQNLVNSHYPHSKSIQVNRISNLCDVGNSTDLTNFCPILKSTACGPSFGPANSSTDSTNPMQTVKKTMKRSIKFVVGASDFESSEEGSRNPASNDYSDTDIILESEKLDRMEVQERIQLEGDLRRWQQARRIMFLNSARLTVERKRDNFRF